MKTLTACAVILFAFGSLSRAQSPLNNTNAVATPVKEAQPYGQADKADLEMKECEFEKNADAEVLFNFVDGFLTPTSGAVEFDYHKRVKIFNEKGGGAGNVRIEYFSEQDLETISGLEAETFNLEDGKIVVTPVDKKQIYKRYIDRFHTEITFAFPNIKPGSIVEFKFKLRSEFLNFPVWFFQGNIPERFNEMKMTIPAGFNYQVQLHANQPFLRNIRKEVSGNLIEQDYAMSNVPAFNHEPFMSSMADNLQSAYFQIRGLANGSYNPYLFDSWATVGQYLLHNHYFGYQLNTSLAAQRDILKEAKQISSYDQKIAFIFSEVKNRMKWDGADDWFTNTGPSNAWDAKTGNSTEINLVLHNLLNSAGVTAYPVMVSTRVHGKVNPAYPGIDRFNRTVVYAEGDHGVTFILDASEKTNVFNRIPANLLNSFGLMLNNKDDIFKTTYLENTEPARETVFINGDITADGTMTGTVQKMSGSYLKDGIVETYKKDGDDKYRKALAGDHINLLDLKVEDMDTDSLPLKQLITFKKDLTGSGEGYIFFSPNILSSFARNPFLSEQRLSDIDFGYLRDYSITGLFKIPAGYTAETLPKNTSMMMPDRSIAFTRITAQQAGVISVRISVDFKKSIYLKEEYPEIKAFYKKMFELLNEQVVLKKS